MATPVFVILKTMWKKTYYTLVVSLVVALLLDKAASSEVKNENNAKVRGKRSDDGGPLEAVVQQLAQQVNSLTAQLNQHVNELTSKLSAQATEIAALKAGAAKDQTSVAFHAEFSSDPVQLGPQAPLILNNVITNVGGGYDASASYFRAPVSGTYMILVNYMGAINQAVYVGIYVDNTLVDYSLSHGDGSHWDHVSESIVLHLLADQRVHLGNTAAAAVEIRGSHWTTFSGFLIQADI